MSDRPKLQADVTRLNGLSESGASHYQELREASKAGELPNMRELWQQLSTLLQDEQFRWPAFAAWQRYFRSVGAMPSSWDESLYGHELLRNGKAKSGYSRDYVNGVARVLAQTLMAESATRRQLAEFRRDLRHGIISGVEVITAGSVTSSVCEELAGIVSDLKLASLPPFYPGCRCGVVATLDEDEFGIDGSEERQAAWPSADWPRTNSVSTQSGIDSVERRRGIGLRAAVFLVVVAVALAVVARSCS